MALGLVGWDPFVALRDREARPDAIGVSLVSRITSKFQEIGQLGEYNRVSGSDVFEEWQAQPEHAH